MGYVLVNSKTAHPSPPLGQTPGHLTFLKNFGQILRYIVSLEGQMPCPLEPQRWSNPPPSRHAKATVETSSGKFSATTNFLFSLSLLNTLNKGIFHNITTSNNNNRKTHMESTRAMTREHGPRPESKNCEILLLPTADRRFDTKVKCPTGRASFWVKFPTVRGLTPFKCPGIARGVDGRFWKWLVHYPQYSAFVLHMHIKPGPVHTNFMKYSQITANTT